MLNYEVDASLLHKFVPAGTQLDRWHDRVFLSLVGFRFLKTKFLGVSVPFHRNFEEVNLRFYVRRAEGQEIRRGVVFIREIVPRWAIAKAARAFYNENYVALPMSNRIDRTGLTELRAEYSWKFRSPGIECTRQGRVNQPCPKPIRKNSLSRNIIGATLRSARVGVWNIVWTTRCGEYGPRRTQPLRAAWKISTALSLQRNSARSPPRPSSRRVRRSLYTAAGGCNPMVADDSGRSTPQEWILYDNQCGVCSSWVQFWRPTLAKRNIDIAGLQEPWVIERLKVTGEALLYDIRFLTRENAVVSGADVYLQVARKIWWAGPFYALFSLPGFNRLLHLGYRWFASNRHRISHSCRLPAPVDAAPGAKDADHPR